jgi:hypothetical protein
MQVCAGAGVQGCGPHPHCDANLWPRALTGAKSRVTLDFDPYFAPRLSGDQADVTHPALCDDHAGHGPPERQHLLLVDG